MSENQIYRYTEKNLADMDWTDVEDAAAWKGSLSDFGWHITSIVTSPAKKRKVTATVPYRSGSLDFSALYGAQAYEDREITIKFQRPLGSPTVGWGTAENLIAWLYDGGRKPMSLVSPAATLSVYNAECTEIETSDLTETFFETVTAHFTADPFKRAIGRKSWQKSVPSGGYLYGTLEVSGAPAEAVVTVTGSGGVRLWDFLPEEWVDSAIITLEPTVTFPAGTSTWLMKPGTRNVAIGQADADGTATGVTISWREGYYY